MPKMHVSFTGRTVISGGYSPPGDDFFPGYGVCNIRGNMHAPYSYSTNTSNGHTSSRIIYLLVIKTKSIPIHYESISNPNRHKHITSTVLVLVQYLLVLRYMCYMCYMSNYHYNHVRKHRGNPPYAYGTVL